MSYVLKAGGLGTNTDSGIMGNSKGRASEAVCGKVGSPVPLVSGQQWAVKAQSTGTLGSIHGLVNTGQQHKPQSAGYAYVEARGQCQVKSNY